MSMTTKTTKITKTVTVTKRETFYEDNYFKDDWNAFDHAIKDIVQKFEPETVPKIDFSNRNTCTDVYRKIRTSNIDKDIYKSQAFEVTEKDDKFQAVMDVKDFTPDDLQVKVLDNKVTIDGKYEKVSPDGMSRSSKSFHKEFTVLSTADLEKISTALSKDGVLTIKIPKKVEAITNTQRTDQTTGTNVAISQPMSPPATQQTNQQLTQTKNQSVDQSNVSTTSKTTKTVTVTKRSTFYDDSYFKDDWNTFDNAVKKVVQQFEPESAPKIDFSNRNTCTDVYRKIRTSNIDKDIYKSQAFEVTEKDDKFQAVMDVKDFTPNDLQVKVVGNMVHIDGKLEKVSPDGMSRSSKSFHKEFSVLSTADLENISTGLSKDGVLTIKVPKKV